MIRKNVKGLIIAFILLFTLPTIAFGAVKGYEYAQVKGLISEAKQLTVTGQFREAIGRLSLAESKWSPKSTRDEIRQEVAKNNELAESNDNYTQGTIQYEGENYKKAIEYFDKVIKDDEHYRTAQSYKEISEKKLEEEKETNKKDSISTQNIATVSQQQIPTITPQSVATEVKNIENLSSLCKVDAEELKAKLRADWNSSIMNASKQENGTEFILKFGEYYMKQYNVWADQYATSKERYCLEHNRDYSNFMAPVLDMPNPF